MDSRRSRTGARFVGSDAQARADSTPPVRCSYCDRPFANGELRALHRGLEHAPQLGESEWEAYETAAAAEHAILRRYKRRYLFVLVGVYFGFLILYAVFA